MLFSEKLWDFLRKISPPYFNGKNAVSFLFFHGHFNKKRPFSLAFLLLMCYNNIVRHIYGATDD